MKSAPGLLVSPSKVTIVGSVEDLPQDYLEQEFVHASSEGQEPEVFTFSHHSPSEFVSRQDLNVLSNPPGQDRDQLLKNQQKRGNLLANLKTERNLPMPLLQPVNPVTCPQICLQLATVLLQPQLHRLYRSPNRFLPVHLNSLLQFHLCRPVHLPADDWLCQKIERLNVWAAECYPSRSQESAGLKQDQFIRTPKSQAKWYKQSCLRPEDPQRPGRSVFSWSDSEARLNAQLSRVTKVTSYPQSGPVSRPILQGILRRWKKMRT